MYLAALELNEGLLLKLFSPVHACFIYNHNKDYSVERILSTSTSLSSDLTGSNLVVPQTVGNACSSSLGPMSFF